MADPIDDLEVSPLARVQRSRVAFALAVTLAALPVVALDNLSATAETNEARIEVSSSGTGAGATADRPTTVATEPTSASTVEPSSTAPPTTVPPATTVEPVAAVARVVAPAPTAPPVTAPPSTAPVTTAPPAPVGGDPNDPATWARLAQCESGGNWSLDTGNGYYGGLQFSLATWTNVGGQGYPHQATSAEQINRGKILQARAGWGQWPSCARKLGLL